MLTASFFSYKGGSGRTSLLYNTIPFLADVLDASPEHPIVIVDCDTESAGLTFLLDCYIDKQTITVQSVCNNGIEDDEAITANITNIRQHPFFKMLPQVGKKFGITADGRDGTILFIPAAKGAIKLNSGSSENRLNELKDVCRRYGAAALIFDTPAGDQRAAKWSVDASKAVVTVMRITNQFRVGTKRYIKENLGEWGGKNIILCPNAVPTHDICIDGVEINLADFKAEKIIDYFSELFENSNNYLDLRMLEGDLFGVNEVERFKYAESVLYAAKHRNDTDEAMAYERYKLLAEILGEY